MTITKLETSSQKCRSTFPPCRLLLTGIFITLGGSFHYGYALSVVNPTVNIFQQFLNESLSLHYGWEMDELSFRFMWSTVACFVVLGGTVGALFLSKLAEHVGRKKGLLISSVLLLISFVLTGLSKFVDAFEVFALGRILCGVGIGLATGFQALFLTEISPTRFRGFMGMLIGAAINVGFFLGNIFGLPQVFGTAELWPLAFFIEIVPTLLLLVALLQSKESPTYLMDMGNIEGARKSIEFYHGAQADVDAVLRDIKEELNVSKHQWNIWQVWGSRPIRNAAVLAIMLNVAISFSGIMAFDLFGTHMLKAIGLSDDAAGYANAGSSFFSIPAAVISAIVVESAGRKFLALSGLFGLAVLNVLMLAMAFAFEQTGASFLGYLFLLFLVLFIFLFSCGVGPLIWFIGAELSPHHARSSVQALAIAAHYISSFLSPIIYFPLEQQFGSFSFLSFVVPLVMTAVYCYWQLPETKNRRIGEIMIDLGAVDLKEKSTEVAG